MHWRRMAALIAFFFITIGCAPYRKGSFHGPATFTDSGYLSYYRYHFQFSPSISLRSPGTFTYTFRGMPRDEMRVWFDVSPFNYREWQQLASLSTRMSVDLKDDRGNTICSGSGPLSEAKRGVPEGQIDHWALAAGAHNAQFWRLACGSVKFRDDRSYTLRVSIAEVDPHTPDLAIIPFIDGGGTELP